MWRHPEKLDENEPRSSSKRGSKTGKWKLLYDPDNAPAAWATAKHLFDNNLLPGILHMECLDKVKNGDKKKISSIMFYCAYKGEATNNAEVLGAIGQNLVFRMQRQQQMCDLWNGRWIDSVTFADQKGNECIAVEGWVK